MRRLSTNRASGLSTDQVKTAVDRVRQEHSVASVVASIPAGIQFTGFGPILFIGSILVFVSWKPFGQPPAQANLALAIVLLAVVFIQAAFNAWQDWSSSRVMASITTMLPDKCLVMRNGVQVTIVASEIVPGDLLLIRMGNKLPADVRFLETSSDTNFDRSILTGRSSLLFLSKLHVHTKAGRGRDHTIRLNDIASLL